MLDWCQEQPFAPPERAIFCPATAAHDTPMPPGALAQALTPATAALQRTRSHSRHAAATPPAGATLTRTESGPQLGLVALRASASAAGYPSAPSASATPSHLQRQQQQQQRRSTALELSWHAGGADADPLDSPTAAGGGGGGGPGLAGGTPREATPGGGGGNEGAAARPVHAVVFRFVSPAPAPAAPPAEAPDPPAVGAGAAAGGGGEKSERRSERSESVLLRVNSEVIRTAEAVGQAASRSASLVMLTVLPLVVQHKPRMLQVRALALGLCLVAAALIFFALQDDKAGEKREDVVVHACMHAAGPR